MRTAISRLIAKRKQTKTEITEVELAKCGFHIIGNEYTLADLTILQWSDGFYHGTKKLNNMNEVSNLVYGR